MVHQATLVKMEMMGIQVLKVKLVPRAQQEMMAIMDSQVLLVHQEKMATTEPWVLQGLMA